jgi:phosphoglycerate kinase
MNLNKLTIKDIDLSGKRVVMRADFNVPLKDGVITDDTRIKAALPTIQYILEQGASLSLLSHLGRPKGERKPEFSLAPVAKRLSELLGKSVPMATDCIGDDVVSMANALSAGDVMLCENTRYHKAEDVKRKTEEECKLQDEMAKELAKLGDVFVNDAFGTAHRAHASTAIIANYVNVAVAGLLMDKEIKFLGQTVENAESPFVAIVGGAKVSGKLEVLKKLIEKVDTVLIGGGMAYTFLKSLGHEIGGSLVEDDLLDVAKKILEDAKSRGVNFLLPVDNLAADGFSNDADIQVVGLSIPADRMALDVGPETAKLYAKEILSAKTVIWNGPMGCFEMPNFANGTMTVCQAVADSSAVSVIGGGDSVAAVNMSGLASKMSHISTGGGASLEFLEGKELPGVVALADAN